MTKELNNPYLNGRREWNERYGNYIADARNWRIAAIISFGVSAMAVGGLAWLASQSRVTPYVVEVNALGEAVPVAIAEKAAQPDARIIRAQLARFITDARSVYSDAQAERKAIDEAYAMINRKGPSFQTLIDYHRENDPFKRSDSVGVNVSIESVLPISDNSYRIEWKEETRGRDGSVISDENWQAVIGIVITPPTDAKQVLINPMGIFINSLNWSQKI